MPLEGNILHAHDEFKLMVTHHLNGEPKESFVNLQDFEDLCDIMAIQVQMANTYATLPHTTLDEETRKSLDNFRKGGVTVL